MYEFLSWLGLNRMCYYVFSLELKCRFLWREVGGGLYMWMQVASETFPQGSESGQT
jgi:hypothetical protein